MNMNVNDRLPTPAKPIDRTGFTVLLLAAPIFLIGYLLSMLPASAAGGTSGQDTAMALIVMAGCLVMYFAPTIVAVNRKHHQTLAIFMTNLLLGWIGIGWIVAIIWACTAVRSRAQ